MQRAIVVSLLSCSVAAAGAPTPVVAQQERTLSIPVVGGAASVQCEYFAELGGDSRHRGRFDWGRVQSQSSVVVINAAPFGEPTIHLRKAFIYCPGFELTVLRDQPIPNASSRLPAIRPAILPTVKLTGHVPGVPAAGGRVEVLHYADWIPEDYGTWDGAVPQFRIASVPLGSDGTFDADLPDWGKDPFVSRFRYPGGFQFTVTIGRTVYQLEPPVEPAAGLGEPHSLLVTPGTTVMHVTFGVSRMR